MGLKLTGLPIQKTCSKCGKLKPSADFRIRRGFILRSWCKECESLYAKSPNSVVARRSSSKNRRNTKINVWREYLKIIYGIHPKCGVCGMELTWGHGNQHDSVVLDHRMNGKEPICEGFYTWASDHECSDENKKLFIESNFGILCRSCNWRIPTVGRMEWLKSIEKYLLSE
jgi:hypothetical protein